MNLAIKVKAIYSHEAVRDNGDEKIMKNGFLKVKSADREVVLCEKL